MLNPVASTLADQFHRVWATLFDALDHLDEAQFQSGDIEFLIPRNLAYHTIETADFYSSDCDADHFSWGHVKAQTKADHIAYAREIEKKVAHWLASMTDQQLLAEQTICEWTGKTILDRAIYALRHTQHHTAQINSELRRRNLPRGEWQ